MRENVASVAFQSIIWTVVGCKKYYIYCFGDQNRGIPRATSSFLYNCRSTIAILL